MKKKYIISPYACKFRINHNGQQVTGNWRSFKECQNAFEEWADKQPFDAMGSYLEYKECDSGEWFPIEEKKEKQIPEPRNRFTKTIHAK